MVTGVNCFLPSSPCSADAKRACGPHSSWYFHKHMSTSATTAPDYSTSHRCRGRLANIDAKFASGDPGVEPWTRPRGFSRPDTSVWGLPASVAESVTVRHVRGYRGFVSFPLWHGLEISDCWGRLCIRVVDARIWVWQISDATFEHLSTTVSHDVDSSVSPPVALATRLMVEAFATFWEDEPNLSNWVT
jgi:hypothetical protein